jgi:hypothetical protein
MFGEGFWNFFFLDPCPDLTRGEGVLGLGEIIF